MPVIPVKISALEVVEKGNKKKNYPFLWVVLLSG